MKHKLLSRLAHVAEQKGFKVEAPPSYEDWKEQHQAEGRAMSLQKQQEAAQHFLDVLMRESDVLVDGKTFGNFEALEEWQAKLVQSCGQFADEVYKTGGDRALILCGGYGTGKTHLCAAITNHICANHIGKTMLAKQWDSIIRKIFGGSNHQFSVDNFIDTLTRVDVLIIDEVGSGERQLSSGQLSTMGEIIRRRANKKDKVTLLTSNFYANDLCDMLGDFVINGFREQGLRLLQIDKCETRNQRSPIDIESF